MKILYVTTIGSTMSFFYEHFKMLLNEGHCIELACNTSSPVAGEIADLGVKVHNIPFSRSPLNKDNLTAYKQLKKLVEDENYDIVHCHTPNAAAITRLACKKLRKKGLKVFYTAHGFHFYKGAPRLNWLVYYPVELLCAHYTDKLVTINSEDYELAKRKMKAKDVEIIHGMGIDTKKFAFNEVIRNERRRELGLEDKDIMLLSVGELNENKNQKVIIKALAKLNNPRLHYFLAGQGPTRDDLNKLIEENNLQNNVKLLGFRSDVAELYSAADIFCFPSYREGLGLSSVEAMACGLPVITSDKHGINDYSVEGVTGHKCDPDDVDGFAAAINDLAFNEDKRKEIGRNNIKCAAKYDSENILPYIDKLYKENI